MPDATTDRPRLAGLVKQEYGPTDPVRQGYAVQVDLAEPQYTTLNDCPVVAHFECRRIEDYETVGRYVGDVIRTEDGLRVAELLRTAE